jgi:hypothetical protein
MDKLTDMAEELRLVKVEKDGEDGLLVTFSDGSLAGYVVEELLAMRPIRELVGVPGASMKRAETVGTSRSLVAAAYSPQI